MDYGKIFEYAGRITSGVLLLLILVAGSQGYWVFGSQYKEAIDERNTWRDLAIKGTKVAEQATARTMLGILGNKPTALAPLPTSPTATDVQRRLDEINRHIKYISEPTDDPL